MDTEKRNTSVIQNNKFIQCPYHIKNADGLGFYQCQEPIDHPTGKHTLPSDGGYYSKVGTLGSWYPTFEEAYQNYKATLK